MKLHPVYIASGIIGVSIVGFLGLSWVLSTWALSEPWPEVLKVLRHGCEGALVGGICDFIAVRMVYDTARQKFPGLRDNTAKVVIKDMVNVRGLISDASKLRDFLADAENQQYFVSLLQDTLPDREEMEENIESFWHDELRTHIIGWLLAVEVEKILTSNEKKYLLDVELFRETGAKILRHVAAEEEENRQLMERVSALSSDVSLSELGIPNEAEQVKQLLSTIWGHWQKIGMTEQGKITQLLSNKLAPTAIDRLGPAIARVVSTTTLKDAIEPLLTEEMIRQLLLSISSQLEQTSAEEPTPEIFEDFIAYLAVFWHGWKGLELAERRAVVEELVRLVEKPMLGWISDAIWALRAQLLTPEVLLEKKVAVHLVERVSEHIQAQAEVAEEQAIKTLQQQFDEMGADGFVDMLRARTKEQLDWIKVNGSGWGFLLGSIAGVIELLF